MLRSRVHPRLVASVIIGLIVLSGAANLTAEGNWPRFRGPNNGAIPDNPKLPDRWSPTENIAWRVDVPGLGWSSPIVWDNTVYVTAVLSSDPIPVPGQDIIEEGKVPGYRGGMSQKPSGMYRWVLYAIDLDSGRIHWANELFQGEPVERRHPKNTYASETPVTDGKRVYVYHASAGLFAVDLSGQLVWQQKPPRPTIRTDVVTKGAVLNDTGKSGNDFSAMFANLGAAASPAIYKNRIFVTADHEPRAWMMAAYSTTDGTPLWRVDLPKTQQAYGWSTPFVWENDQRTEIVAAGDMRTRSFDWDGKLLWELKGLSVNTTPTPFAVGNTLYVTSGYPGTQLRPVFAIRPGGSGDISLKDGEASNAHVVWHQRAAATYMPSALVYRDRMYNLYSQGFLTAHDAKTGEQVYGRRRVDVGATGFTASPGAYNGKVFVASEDGDVYVVQAGDEYKLLHKNSLNEMIIATPAVAGDSLPVRTVGRLYRIANAPAK
jgi:outer membrane protein assembly factor BamB